MSWMTYHLWRSDSDYPAEKGYQPRSNCISEYPGISVRTPHFDHHAGIMSEITETWYDQTRSRSIYHMDVVRKMAGIGKAGSEDNAVPNHVYSEQGGASDGAPQHCESCRISMSVSMNPRAPTLHKSDGAGERLRITVLWDVMSGEAQERMTWCTAIRGGERNMAVVLNGKQRVRRTCGWRSGSW
ncbi:hypothetical protein CERSUDRAFT_127327 [Gelatoporia subvermispora B]|uniref:Uncharacterized protein n=1 Tax=Ceriporiopsis subvermispora (strain B) TaxID=914234 RepID=M2QYK7_CERS8|nr:hypothetical protein CERSUDRAFT_127327 [Gelatoporia subvermispora B]